MRHCNYSSSLRFGRAFTLLEVLLATLIFGMTLAAITLTLRTGIQAWSTGHGISEVLQTARITRDVLMSDLNNMVFLNESNYNIAYRSHLDQLANALYGDEDNDNDNRRGRRGRDDRRDRPSRREERENEEAVEDMMEELSIDTISPPIDLSFRGEDREKTDRLTFARQYQARPFDEAQTWGLRRVTYFVKDKVLYRQERDPYGFRPGAQAMDFYYDNEDLLNIASQFFLDEAGVDSDEIDADTPIPGLPMTMQVNVAEPLCDGVEIFDLTFGYFKEGEWVEVPHWDSGGNEYRTIPFDEITDDHFEDLRDEERQRYLQQKRMAKIFSRPDELPGTIAIQIGIRPPSGQGKIYSFTLYHNLLLAQETDTLPDRSILEDGAGFVPGMMPGMTGMGLRRSHRGRNR